MNTPLIITVAGGCLIAAWFAWSLSWTARQSLLGTWVAALPDGSHVTLQFEGGPKDGIYKQLVRRDGAESREFGHWTIKILELRLIIMATDFAILITAIVADRGDWGNSSTAHRRNRPSR